MLGQLSTIWKYRSFWLSLVRMDLRTRYRRSILGVGWSLLNPILMTITFCLVFSSWFENPDWRSYAPYFLAGLSIWEFIKQSATQGCQTFFRNESYIRQCPLPLTIYSLRTVLGTAIHFLIAMGVVVLTISLLMKDNQLRALSVLWAVLPMILLLFLFAWALSVISAFMTVFFQDTQQLLDVVFQISFFLTPIMYKVELLESRNLGILASINPAVTFFALIRDPLLTGHLPPAYMLYKGMAITLFFMGIAVALTARLEKKLIFRL